MADRFWIVGLLGGIASGKSSVAAEFERLGAARLDADKLAHEALEQADVLTEIKKHFGDTVFESNGALNRKSLASKVFSNESERKELEKIIHPRVRKKIEESIDSLRREQKTNVVLLDVPLLAEGGLSKRCDVTVFVDTPKSARIERAHKTRGWTAAELELRERAQGDLETKRRQANFVVNNADSLDEMKRQVKKVFEQIVSGKR